MIDSFVCRELKDAFSLSVSHHPVDRRSSLHTAANHKIQLVIIIESIFTLNSIQREEETREDRTGQIRIGREKGKDGIIDITEQKFRY